MALSEMSGTLRPNTQWNTSSSGSGRSGRPRLRAKGALSPSGRRSPQSAP